MGREKRILRCIIPDLFTLHPTVDNDPNQTILKKHKTIFHYHGSRLGVSPTDSFDNGAKSCG